MDAYMNSLVTVKTNSGLSGFRDYLRSTSENAITKLIGLAGHLSSGKRGKYATMALNMAGVTSDKQAFSEVYSRHPDQINAYFEYVDLNKLARLLDVERSIVETAPRRMAKAGGFLAAGAIIGVAGLTLYKRKKTSR
jgi:hypothetical protein